MLPTPVLLPKYCRGFWKLQDEVFPRLWWKHKVLSINKKKHMYSHFANISMRFFIPTRHCKDHVYVCVPVCVRAFCGEEKEMRSGHWVKDVISSLLLADVCFSSSSCHSEEWPSRRSKDGTNLSRGYPYHVVHVGISTRTPAVLKPTAPALATLTPDQLSSHNPSNCPREGSKRFGSEIAIVF